MSLDELSKDKPTSKQPQLRPRLGKIPVAKRYCGLGRTRLYELAAKYAGLFRKSGSSTLVEFDILDKILDELPPADLKPIPVLHTAEATEKRRKTRRQRSRAAQTDLTP